MKTVLARFNDYKKDRVKKFWKKTQTSCPNADRILNAISDEESKKLKSVLEFGCSWGGNLKYFMDNITDINTVGIDINENVKTLVGEYPNFKAIVGDEKELFNFERNTFDLSFTISVLDHIPFNNTVADILDCLLKISRRVMLLEPYIEGVCGDVSNKTRDKIKQGLERSDKKFAPYSYIWNYDEMLNKRSMEWKKTLTRLHDASLGPFYYLYDIDCYNI